MKCPHCLVSFHDSWAEWSHLTNTGWKKVQKDWNSDFTFQTTICPTCTQIICVVTKTDKNDRTEITAYPTKAATRPVPPEVNAAFANDFKEACLVIGDSEKASAALSRRCLQNILIEKAAAQEKTNLSLQIQEVIDSGKLPSHLTENMDAIRNIGNFAAHPIKSERTGEVIEVETGEAEWLLDILEELFDFYFVQPAKSRERKAAFNKKLEEAGKPELKGGAAG